MASGTIKRIQRDKGFGFIRDNSGQEYFFHRSAVQGSFDSLSEGPARELRRGAVAERPARRQRSSRIAQSFVAQSPGSSRQTRRSSPTLSTRGYRLAFDDRYFLAAGVNVVSRRSPLRR